MPIEISTDEDDASVGSKRRREDSGEMDSGASKKWKGKEKEVAPSNPHPPRPKPKKTLARVAKVSDSFLFITHLLKIPRSTYCT